MQGRNFESIHIGNTFVVLEKINNAISLPVKLGHLNFDFDYL